MENNANNGAPNPGNPNRSAPQQETPPVKTRRVGTLTFGLVMVVVGVLLIIKLIRPAFDLNLILRFSPVILITLGLEVLVYAARPDVKMKYDFLSMFLCFLVICAAACGSAFVELRAYYTPELNGVQQRLAAELEQSLQTALKEQAGMIRDADVHVDLNQVRGRVYSGMTVAQIGAEDDVYVDLTMNAQYNSKEAFAADCKTILDAANAGGLPIKKYRFHTWEGDGVQQDGTSYVLSVGGWLMDADQAQLASNANAQWWWDGDAFDSAEKRDRAIGQATAESAAEANEAASEAYQNGYDAGYASGCSDAGTENADAA